MTRAKEKLSKDWAQMLASHPDVAEHFSRVLRGEESHITEDKLSLDRQEPLKGRTAQTDIKKPSQANSGGCESILNYFREVGKNAS